MLIQNSKTIYSLYVFSLFLFLGAILHRDFNPQLSIQKSLFRPGYSWVPSRLSSGTASVTLRLHYYPYRNVRSLGVVHSQSCTAAKALAQIPEVLT